MCGDEPRRAPARRGPERFIHYEHHRHQKEQRAEHAGEVQLRASGRAPGNRSAGRNANHAAIASAAAPTIQTSIRSGRSGASHGCNPKRASMNFRASAKLTCAVARRSPDAFARQSRGARLRNI
jgi:hypothetical protein